MADFQTQVIDQSTITSQDLNVQARVDQFKQQLSSTRAIRVQLVEQMRGIVDQVKTLAQSRADLVGMFRSEASAMHPEMVVQDAWAFAQSSGAPFDLYQLWQIYVQKQQALTSKIEVLKNQYNVLASKDQMLAADEQNTLHLYASLNLPGAPSPEQLMAQVQVVDVIPTVDESSTIVSASALEHLTPEAADMVTLQAVDMESNYDRQEVNQDLIYSMAPQSSEVAQSSIVSEAEGIFQKLKENWKLVAVGVAVGYFVFGGREK